MNDFNAGVIEQFRATGGDSGRWGRDLVVLHSIGAKSGEERLNPVMGIRDGDGWLVAASKGGSPENPAWYHNLLAHPEIDLEVAGDTGVEVVPVTATVVDDAGYPAAWKRFTDRSPAFAQYAARATRRIPVIRLTPR